MIYLAIGLFAGLVALAMTRRPLPALINFVGFSVLSWACMPTLAVDFYGTIFLFCLILAAGWAWNMGSENTSERTVVYGWGWISVNAALLLVVLPALTTWSAFHSGSYRELLQVEEKEFNPHQVLLDQTQVRFVDEELARRSANELLGKDLGLGSKVEIGSMHKQSIKGRLWWVAPLEHKGFWKWASNDTTAGFIMVSANDYRDRRIVDTYKLRYGLNAYFGDNVERHLYQVFPTLGLTDYTFELDENEYPYWIVTIYEPKIGFGGYTATGVVVLDPVTGEHKRYGIDDAPAWIDRIQPESFIHQRIDDWGQFVHGWWNSWIGENDVIETSPNSSLVYTVDGRCAFYTGLQSTSGSHEQRDHQEGTMGFMLSDSRTGKAVFYRRAGITEAAAKKVIEGQVQDKGYTATWPVMYLVNDLPTFVAVLKDHSGNGQMIGLVAYDDRTMLSVGTTLDEALRTYAAAQRKRGTAIAVDGEVEMRTFEGTVVRVGQETVDRETIAYIMIDTMPDKGFSIPAQAFPEVLLTQRGDQVKLSAQDTTAGIIYVTAFDNLAFMLDVTQDQKVVDERYKAGQKARQDRGDQLSTDAIMRKLGGDLGKLRRLMQAIEKEGGGS